MAYNFAYGGATVDADIVAPYIDTVVCMDDQVKIFLDFIDKTPKNVPWTKSNALVGVWIGVNDVGNSYYRENSTDILKRDLARYFELLQKLYDAGLRKFALLSVPRKPLGPATVTLELPINSSISNQLDTTDAAARCGIECSSCLIY